MEMLGAIVLVFALQKIAALLSIPVILGMIWVKGKASRMDGEAWSNIFDRSVTGSMWFSCLFPTGYLCFCSLHLGTVSMIFFPDRSSHFSGSDLFVRHLSYDPEIG